MMDKETFEGTLQPRPVLHILVIGFHHQRGAKVEFVFPKFSDGNLTKNLPAPWHPLLFVALPDGAHNYEEDYVFFSLPSLKGDNSEQPGQVYGVACFQQIDSKDLKVKDDDVTRTSVQKSVVLILRKPLFGFILSKLSLITQAYFNEKDFSQTTILKDTYTALNQTSSTSKQSKSIFYMGLSLGELVMKLRKKVLVLIKLILMEKKVVLWGCPVGMVCTTMMSLLSLLPGFYNSEIFHDPNELNKADNINEDSSKDQYGLPLEIFGEEYSLHPYLSMQQMSSLKSDETKGYVIGASNLLFKHRTHLEWDALVDLERNELVIPDHDLNQSLSLTTEDLRFADFINSTVSEYRNNSGISWDGSDDWIRLQFKYYVLCLLASTTPEKGNSSHIHKQFNDEFINNWKQTNNHKKWIEHKHLGLESIHQGHPFEGGLTISDVKLRIQSRIDALSISDESREKLGAAVQKTGQVVGSAFNSAKNAISSWRGWFSGIVQEINDEMQANSVNLELVNSNDEEIDGSSEELSHGMVIRERTGNSESA